MVMAKRLYTKKGNKIQPSAMTLAFTIPAPGGVVSYIDLSQVASLVNRRFYRQGINWAVAGFKVLTDAGVTGSVKIAKLPNTWVMSNAWEKGFRVWQRMNNKALEEAESVRPKFLDFKIYADFTHAQSGVGANLLPVNASGVAGTYAPGEWEMSKYAQPDPTVANSVYDREIIATGASYPGAGASGINSVS